MNLHAQPEIFKSDPDWEGQDICALTASDPKCGGRFTLIAVKTAEAGDFLSTLHSILPEGSQVIVDGMLRRPKNEAVQAAATMLTPRQIQLINLLKLNLSNKDIGRRLHLSHFTVRNMVCQLLRTFDVRSRKDLARLFEKPVGQR